MCYQINFNKTKAIAIDGLYRSSIFRESIEIEQHNKANKRRNALYLPATWKKVIPEVRISPRRLLASRETGQTIPLTHLVINREQFQKNSSREVKRSKQGRSLV